MAASARGELTQVKAALVGRMEAILDSAMDAIITVDEAQRVVYFNRAAEQMFGLPRESALGAPLERFLPGRFRDAHRRHVEEFGRTGVTSRRMGETPTLWALRADGSEFPIEASISQAGETGSRFYTVILRDITARHQFAARILEAREEEKTLIARELHDELGQLLTALKMDLAWLREQLSSRELLQRADEMGRMLDQTVAATRRISADLRPLMLDDLGLADAATWLVEDFGKRSGVRCELAIDGIAALEISKAVATALYRALQESLTNIARHSGARHAWVALAADDGTVSLEVEDDGRGIGPEDIAKKRSLGLKGMRERVTYFGGSFEVGRAARGGTRVQLKVPA
jgi:PAS domain S-box-containing protein